MIPVLYKSKQYLLEKVEKGYLYLWSNEPYCTCGDCYDCDDGAADWESTEVKITRYVDVNAIIRSTYDIVESAAERLLKQSEYGSSKRLTKTMQKKLLECIPT